MNGLFQWLANLIQSVKFWAVVAPWERGVRVRLGKHACLLDPGWHIRIPIVDSVRLVNSRLRVGVFPSQTITTTDGRTITVAGNIGFRIVDPLAAMLALQQPEISCAAFVQATVAAYISDRTREEINVREMEAEAKDDLERIASGIEFEFVRVTDFAAVKTFRLLQEQWRPSTSLDTHDKENAMQQATAD